MPKLTSKKTDAEDQACQTHFIEEGRVNFVRERMVADTTLANLSDTFRALGDLTRMKILWSLSQTELCVCDLAGLINQSESAVSHQLRVLRNLKIVKYRRAGRITYYSLDDKHIVNLLREGSKHVQEGE
ncbi:MAG: ArsR/SmtB family transcription factor [Terriglobia bacterium]